MRYAVIDVAIMKHYCNRTHVGNEGSYNANGVILESISVISLFPQYMHIAQCACTLYVAGCNILTNGTVNIYKRAWPW